jgi:hypothetical protein
MAVRRRHAGVCAGDFVQGERLVLSRLCSNFARNSRRPRGYVLEKRAKNEHKRAQTSIGRTQNPPRISGNGDCSDVAHEMLLSTRPAIRTRSPIPTPKGL